MEMDQLSGNLALFMCGRVLEGGGWWHVTDYSSERICMFERVSVTVHTHTHTHHALQIKK